MHDKPVDHGYENTINPASDNAQASSKPTLCSIMIRQQITARVSLGKPVVTVCRIKDYVIYSFGLNK